MSRPRSSPKSVRTEVPPERVFKRFAAGSRSGSLSGLCHLLLESQLRSWRALREAYESLDGVRQREVACRGFSVRLQHNRARLANSLTGFNREAGEGRACFLCLSNLPAEQKGIAYGEDFLILCNPRPAFHGHLTVSCVEHRSQAVEPHIITFLALTAHLGPRWTTMYNGPRCGASAPDHLHFQIIPSGKMPIEDQLARGERLILLMRPPGLAVYGARELGREVVVLEGDDPAGLGRTFGRLMDGLRSVLGADGEPMINVAGTFGDGRWRLIVFPRSRHRPAAFFSEGEDRIVVSPGVVEMGGTLITPVERDFERLDGPSVEAIYREVSIDGRVIGKAVGLMG